MENFAKACAIAGCLVLLVALLVTGIVHLTGFMGLVVFMLVLLCLGGVGLFGVLILMIKEWLDQQG